MQKIIKTNRWFLFPYLLFLIGISTILILYSKKDIHLFLNGFNSNFADMFFAKLTYLGDGIAVGLFIFILLFVRYRYALMAFISTFFITDIVQTLKHIVFADVCRPSAYFANSAETLHYVEGVKLHTAHSFPSGHTASAFTIFFILAMICKNNTLKFAFFLIALLTAFSRIYLSQHFLIDIYFGSIIAVTISLVCYFWIMRWKNPKLDYNLLKNK